MSSLVRRADNYDNWCKSPLPTKRPRVSRLLLCFQDFYWYKCLSQENFSLLLVTFLFTMMLQIAEDSEQTSTKTRQRRALLGLLTRPLKHTTVRILRNDNCRRIDITIRIKCVRAVWNRPSEEQATKLCELVKASIKKHWEVAILDNAGKSLNSLQKKIVFLTFENCNPFW